MQALKINGTTVEVQAEPDTPLLCVLRGEPRMGGIKFGCGMALCGACAVHLDGRPIRSCVTPIAALGGGEVTTIEGLQGREAAALKAAWIELDVVQCGYCQSGQLMSACAAAPAAAAERRRHQRCDGGQHLPLRHLPAHACGDPSRRAAQRQVNRGEGGGLRPCERR